jgi:hypothetical protein
MSTEGATESDDEPWPQRVMDSIWLLALAAVLYFVLSYVVWGFIDIAAVPTG